jgi:hypothetical protein
MRRKATIQKPARKARLTQGQELLLHGHCHLLAVALSRITGLKIFAYLDEDEELEDLDLPTGNTALVHAFVSEDGGRSGIDVRGRRASSRMLREFEWNEPELVELTEAEVLQLGHGRQRLSQRDPAYQAAYTEALVLAKRLGLRQVNRHAQSSRRGKDSPSS